MSELLREAISAAEKAVAGEDSAVDDYVERLLGNSAELQLGDTDDRVYLAALLDATGRGAAATSVLREPTGPRPGAESAALLNMRGMLAAAHGQYEQARQLLREALEAAADSPDLRVKILANLAAVTLEVGSVAEAEAWADASAALAEPGASAADVLVATVRAGIASQRGDLPSLGAAAIRLADVSEARITDLGTSHPRALGLVANLARTELALARAEDSPDRIDRAVDVLEVASLRLAAELGADHRDSLAARASLEAAMTDQPALASTAEKKASESPASVEIRQPENAGAARAVTAGQPGTRSAAASRPPFADLLARLGGGNTAILAQLPEERARFVQMAGVLLSTAAIAAISMMFALHDAVRSPLAMAVVLGLFWGVVILNLDRFLVVSMGRTRNRVQLASMAVPRLLLAGLIALVISTPLVLRIFAPDITAQLAVVHQQRANQIAALSAQSAPARQASQLLAQINADQATLAGNLPNPVTSPQLQDAQTSVTELQDEVAKAYQAEITARETWECQLYGTSCRGASGVLGNGPIAQADYKQYQQAVSAYESAEAQLANAQAAEKTAQAGVTKTESTLLAQLRTNAQSELPALQDQYLQLEREVQAQSAQADAANNADSGILAQLQALSEVRAQNPSLEIAQLTVFLLFFVIEFLPVAVRFLLNIGPQSAYERIAEYQEREATELSLIRLNAERHIEEEKARHRMSVETLLREKEEAELVSRYEAGSPSHPPAGFTVPSDPERWASM